MAYPSASAVPMSGRVPLSRPPAAPGRRTPSAGPSQVLLAKALLAHMGKPKVHQNDLAEDRHDAAMAPRR